ncbi:MAG: pyridoxamine 5'-phosphate oxidase [Rhodothermales bacterium]
MPTANVADLRRTYTLADLSEQGADADPLRFFERWFDEAVSAEVREPNAMTLATLGADGQPAARIVLLKGVDAEGFVFYTNYESRKARELEAHPRAALVFWWEALERQVRIEGTVGRVDAAESDAYFASRPRGSRLGAWASDQSRPIADRAVLEEKLAEVEAAYPGDAVPRPPHWGGYRLTPTLFEFWQGRASRLHDRLEYTPGPDGWTIRRLAP